MAFIIHTPYVYLNKSCANVEIYIVVLSMKKEANKKR